MTDKTILYVDIFYAYKRKRIWTAKIKPLKTCIVKEDLENVESDKRLLKKIDSDSPGSASNQKIKILEIVIKKELSETVRPNSSTKKKA